MDNKVVSILMFAAGVTVGSIVTWKLIKKKYEQIAQEEIDSVKEVFSNRHNENIKCPEPEENDSPETITSSWFGDEDKKKLRDIITDESYLSDDEIVEANLTEEVDNHAEKPYVISPDIFGEYYGYDTVSLTLYSDMVLADENNEIIEDVEDSVGFESLNHFGEYEDDAVHVRNEKYGCDYEILRDLRKYTDVIKKSHQAEE